MKFRLIQGGSHADAELAGAAERYLNRIRHFFPIEVINVASERGRQAQSDVAIMRAQSARLLAAIPDRGYTVVLDERGQTFDSLKFAKWIERLTIDSPHGVNFVIGGDVGFDDTVRKRADKLLALTPMTLPHQFARVILLEQLYRACTLMRNIPYHK
ncbi:MAG TPA: 23S rRNA (pseudouridine(1915)-N(3))-methyltransferase RlmH [Thermoanaerobaculia bacterium]|jgi:23S rRNA (pseudouridine1915-N3)-methyltransferase|nr:23S rRNA (pseudouridine(1915)-N(3))-methyltransferase RlmH [Thermoanaerobaculia bacterium]